MMLEDRIAKIRRYCAESNLYYEVNENEARKNIIYLLEQLDEAKAEIDRLNRTTDSLLQQWDHERKAIELACKQISKYLDVDQLAELSKEKQEKQLAHITPSYWRKQARGEEC